MDSQLKSIHKGRVWHVVALELDGQCPTEEYFRDAERRNSKDLQQLVARIHRVSGQEHESNPEIFRHERDGIYVFKTRKGLRLYCFLDEGRLIVTVTGADKPKKKQQQKDIEEAARWRDRYLAFKEQNSEIPIIDD
jgi:hypothetical protein